MALEDVTNEERSRLGRIKPVLVATSVITCIVAVGTIAILTYSIVANSDLPKQLWNIVSRNQKAEHYVPVESPYTVFTPAPKIDSLAVIRAYQPDLAAIIERQGWFKDGLDTGEQATLSELGKNVSSDAKGYLQDKLMLNGVEKDVAILYDKGLESRAQEAATYLKTALPRTQAFFGLPVNWSILFLRLNQLEEGNRDAGGGGASGGIAGSNVDSSNWSYLEGVIGHEVGGHTIVDQDSKGSPIWYNESLAEIGRYVSREEASGLENRFVNLLSSHIEDGWLLNKPLSEFTFEDHERTAEHGYRGMYVLLTYRTLAGHDAFKQFVSDVDSIKRSRKLTNEDIREKMLLHTPEQFKVDVAKMYDAQVYGK